LRQHLCFDGTSSALLLITRSIAAIGLLVQGAFLYLGFYRFQDVH